MVLSKRAIVGLVIALLVFWLGRYNKTKTSVSDVVHNRSFLLTGGGTGIGREIAKHICEQGGRVYITGRTEVNLNTTCAALNSGKHEPCCFFGVFDAATEGAEQGGYFRALFDMTVQRAVSGQRWGWSRR
jgi:hypothetical protein